jgi:tetratricopeptide (TPR) repeat protein/cell division protein FtsB
VNERTIFMEALERATPGERAAFLDAACAGDPALRERVEALLRSHDDAGKFLGTPVPERLAGAAPDDTRTSPAAAESDEPTAGGGPAGPATAALIGGRYKLIEQVGEGGMGTVWLAQQTEPVRRSVAVKLIKPGMDSRQVLARFEAERQALALMDHPNIAKVHDAGATPDGRPFFVMELVKGTPITRYCDDHRLTPQQRLELFVPVCQAIQHAHQKGVIHRDLKPSNVLVAQYDGRPVPKVIDFGVAKAAGQPLTDKTLVTGFGAIVGTLEYMSPEQAELNQLDIDTRSDIYSLGVLLYELLAGSPPFTKGDLERAGMLEMLRVIREQEPSRPSTKLSSSDALPTLSANRGTEPARLTRLVRGELDWIVMKALEKDRNRRYETATGFAADVQRYLSDEPVQAGRPTAAYRLRKFVRRNKTSVGIAALVLFFLLLLGGGAGWAVRDRAAREAERAQERSQRLAKTTAQVETIFAEIERLEAEQKWPEALAAARRAQAVVAGSEADPDTSNRVRQVLADLEMVARLEEVRLREGELFVGANFDHAAADRLYAAAFRDYGVDLETLSAEEAATRLSSRSGIVGRLAAGLDQWAANSDWDGNDKLARDLSKLAASLDPDPWRLRLRQAVAAEDTPALLALAKAPDTARQPAQSQLLLANSLPRGCEPQAIALLERASEAYPADFWIHYQLGRMNHDLKRLEAEVRHYTAARALRPQNSVIWVNHGFALSAQGKLDEAIVCFHQAIELDSKNWMAYLNLGSVLGDQGKLDEAVVWHRKAIALAPKGDALVDLVNTSVAAVLNENLGGDLAQQGKLDEAIAYLHKAIELDPKYAKAHYQLGAVLGMQKQWGEAIAEFREAVRLKTDDALAHDGLGNALYERGELDQAIAEFREAIRLEPDLATAHGGLGNALRDKGQLDRAIAEYREAIRLKPDLAESHGNLGVALAAKGRLDEAIAEYREAIRLKKDSAEAHSNLGIALRDEGQLDQAIAEYREAIRLKPDRAEPHHNLGTALRDKGQLDQAIAEYREAIRLKPDLAESHNRLGALLRAKGQLDQAIAEYREAIRLKPDLAESHHALGVALRDKGQRDEAIAEFREAIRLKPDWPEVRQNLGKSLATNQAWGEAIAEYSKAIELEPKFALAQNNLAWLLSTCPAAKFHDPRRAVELAKKAVELAPKQRIYWNTLGIAQYVAGDYKAAIDALNKSMELSQGGDANDWFFLAMARWRLDDKKDARQWYDRAVEWMEKNEPRNEELGRFRAEAEKLLELKK